MSGKRYKVLTDHCTLAETGKTVTLDPSPAVDALVAAGHLEAVASSKTTTTKK